MTENADEKPSQKSHQSRAKEKRAIRRGRKGGATQGKRADIRKPIQDTPVFPVEEHLRGSRSKTEPSFLQGGIEGLDPREAIQQWHEFAQAKSYHLVAGKRRFVSDLDRVNTCIEEEESLFAFCRWRGMRFAEAMPFLQRGTATKEGFEHQVFYPLENDALPLRVTKITFPGKYGRIEHTPFLYLERLALCNEMFPGSDVRFEDCVKTAANEYSIITRMRFFTGPPPALEEVDNFLRSLGFTPHSDGSSTIDYRSPSLEIILRDCHPKNWVKSDQGILMPIDISPEIG